MQSARLRSHSVLSVLIGMVVVDRADRAVMRPCTAAYSDVLFVHEFVHEHRRTRLGNAGVLRKREGVTQTSRNPLLDMVRLQELNSSRKTSSYKASRDSLISTCPQMCPQSLGAF